MRAQLTYTYTIAGAANDGPAVALAMVRGHRQVIARGQLRHHRLTLTFPRLHRGRYRVILIERRAHQAPRIIGRTTIVVT